MVCMNILAGGLSDLFIALYCFDPSTSSLSLTKKFTSGQGPSWITFNHDKTILYATNEKYPPPGALQAFDVSPNGNLTNAISTVSSGGSGPAHCAQLSNGQVAIMNYNDGNGKVISTQGKEDVFLNNAPLITFPPPKGGVSHPHEVYEYGSEVFIPDLGADQIWRLSNSTGQWAIHGNIPQSLGSGPRHIYIRDNYLYALHELASSLTLQKLGPAANETAINYIANVSIIPPHRPTGSHYQAAEILMPEPTGDFGEYIYVSNRNTGTADSIGDAIAIFQHVNKGQANETLQLVNQFYTGLDQLRGMQFDDSKQYLVAAGVAGNAGTIVLKRTDGGKNFTIVAHNTDIATRSSFVWV